MNKKDWALHYAEMGWRIFPLQPNSKIPYEQSNGFKDATDNIFQVEQWWTNTPEANIGLATGTGSGVWVVDLDVKNDKDGRESLRNFMRESEASQLQTKRVKTPSGGRHFYVQLPHGVTVTSRNNVLTGIDIRGDGGYVVLPPSSIDGKFYEWDPRINSYVAHSGLFERLATYSREFKRDERSKSLKADHSVTIPWDMQLGKITPKTAKVGLKYRCKCPHHQDSHASAFFYLLRPNRGYLFCSTCDTTWFTDPTARQLTSDEYIITHLAKKKGEHK